MSATVNIHPDRNADLGHRLGYHCEWQVFGEDQDVRVLTIAGDGTTVCFFDMNEADVRRLLRAASEAIVSVSQ